MRRRGFEEASLLDDCEEERVPFKQNQRSGWRPPTLPPLSVRLPQLTGAALGTSAPLSPRSGPHRYATVAGEKAAQEQEVSPRARERMAPSERPNGKCALACAGARRHGMGDKAATIHRAILGMRLGRGIGWLVGWFSTSF